jgi:hypothetical protein
MVPALLHDGRAATESAVTDEYPDRFGLNNDSLVKGVDLLTSSTIFEPQSSQDRAP